MLWLSNDFTMHRTVLSHRELLVHQRFPDRKTEWWDFQKLSKPNGHVSRDKAAVIFHRPSKGGYTVLSKLFLILKWKFWKGNLSYFIFVLLIHSWSMTIHWFLDNLAELKPIKKNQKQEQNWFSLVQQLLMTVSILHTGFLSGLNLNMPSTCLYNRISSYL